MRSHPLKNMVFIVKVAKIGNNPGTLLQSIGKYKDNRQRLTGYKYTFSLNSRSFLTEDDEDLQADIFLLLQPYGVKEKLTTS